MQRIVPAAVATLILGACASCVIKTDPTTSSLDATISETPSITLVRRVTPEHSTKLIEAYGLEWQEATVSSSQFGAAGSLADPSCVVNGLKKQIPSVEIISTALFWDRVAGSAEEMTLADFFSSASRNQWKTDQPDILIIAYHNIVDVENKFGEVVITGGYSDKDKETASVVVVDLRNENVVHASETAFEHYEAVEHHLIVIPLAGSIVPSSNPCEIVGENAGQAIAQLTWNSPPRVTVVAAGNNPYRAVREIYWEEQAQYLEDGCRIPFNEIQEWDQTVLKKRVSTCESLGRRARRGDPDAMYQFASQLRIGASLERIRWYCRAGHAGHAKAQYRLARYHHAGIVIKKDTVLAHVWYTLSLEHEDSSEVAGQKELLSRSMNSDEITEANRLVAEWKPNPAECDEIGVQADN